MVNVCSDLRTSENLSRTVFNLFSKTFSKVGPAAGPGRSCLLFCSNSVSDKPHNNKIVIDVTPSNDCNFDQMFKKGVLYY